MKTIFTGSHAYNLLCKDYISAENSLYYIKIFLFQYLNTGDDSEFIESHGCNREANSPGKFFTPPPGKMCWSKFTTIGHSLKIPPHTPKTLLPLVSHARWQVEIGSRLASHKISAASYCNRSNENKVRWPRNKTQHVVQQISQNILVLTWSLRQLNRKNDKSLVHYNSHYLVWLHPFCSRSCWKSHKAVVAVEITKSCVLLLSATGKYN